MSTIYSPSASISNYQLAPYTTPLTNSIDTIFSHIEYSFTRKQVWKTDFERYSDQQLELMPQAIIGLNEFTITKETWTAADIVLLEAFIDANMGAAWPFYFTAPDDGESYLVRFKDDLIEYSVPSALTRTGQIVLVEIGDYDNSLNNDLVYPSYVEPTQITISSGFSFSPSAQTISVNTISRLQASQSIIVGLDQTIIPPYGQETVTIVSLPSSTQIRAIFLNNHYAGEVIVAA